MIVLCDLSQYLKYEIEPPRTLSFYSTYIRIMSTRKAKADFTMERKMNLITSLWDRRVSWWNVRILNLFSKKGKLQAFSHFANSTATNNACLREIMLMVIGNKIFTIIVIFIIPNQVWTN